MAILHFAYTFDSDIFHERLRPKVVYNGRLDVRKLQLLAKSMVDSASDELQLILSHLRYDSEWLEDPDRDQSQAYLWYMVVLASAFNPCPSLSNNRFRYSHLVLEKVLPLAGWKKEQIYELIFGKYSLDTLLTDPGDRIFADNLSLYGGALNTVEVQSILSHLELSRESFLSSVSEIRAAIEEYVVHTEIPPSEILRMTYEDAVDMLSTSIARNEALYLLRDS